MRIKEMSVSDRPRERLARLGVGSLSDAELLAVILGRGTRKENVLVLSQRLLSEYSLDRLAACSLGELESFHGVGRAKACQVLALFELSRRRERVTRSSPVGCARDVYLFCKPLMSDLDREMFLVLLLDTKNAVIGTEQVSVGTLNSSIVHPREVFKAAIKESANSVVLVHNHPSGDCAPSDEDRRVTNQLRKVGKVVGIKVLDHVIVGDACWYSFTEERTGHT